MDAPHDSDPPNPLRDARLEAAIEETLARLKELESELAELIERIRWQMYLGYDERSVEFVKKLDTHR